MKIKRPTAKFYVMNGERKFLCVAKSAEDAIAELIARIQDRLHFKDIHGIPLATFEWSVFTVSQKGFRHYDGTTLAPDWIIGVDQAYEWFDAKQKAYDPFCENEELKAAHDDYFDCGEDDE